MSGTASTRFPMLEEMLRIKGLSLQATYSITDIAALFGVSPRAVQRRVAAGQIPSRDLPGRARFLSEDLEAFLMASRKNARRRGN
jgi:Helix-turn-helix domain